MCGVRRVSDPHSLTQFLGEGRVIDTNDGTQSRVDPFRLMRDPQTGEVISSGHDNGTSAAHVRFFQRRVAVCISENDLKLIGQAGNRLPVFVTLDPDYRNPHIDQFFRHSCADIAQSHHNAMIFQRSRSSTQRLIHAEGHDIIRDNPVQHRHKSHACQHYETAIDFKGVRRVFKGNVSKTNRCDHRNHKVNGVDPTMRFRVKPMKDGDTRNKQNSQSNKRDTQGGRRLTNDLSERLEGAQGTMKQGLHSCLELFE